MILDFNPTEGAGGTVVTINGRNFSSSITGNVVKFGKATAIITEASSDKLVVSLPVNLSVAGQVT
ncbi:MAG: IPT/TIG domain-containing protein [Bacteroidales bacterium]|nr:IPT/TIG domain-containing protein [Bacteroidales bacterium]